jgi:hypothetical protein
MTLVEACRDTLRVIRAERGANPDELRQTLDEGEMLSGKIDELWHEGWRGYAPFVYDTEKVVLHSEEFVTDEGVHVNQVECLWSVVNPWLQKFRGLSKPGLGQSVRTYGFVRTLNLAGVPLSGLIDCFTLNMFVEL